MSKHSSPSGDFDLDLGGFKREAPDIAVPYLVEGEYRPFFEGLAVSCWFLTKLKVNS
jgi:hypothetical protein